MSHVRLRYNTIRHDKVDSSHRCMFQSQCQTNGPRMRCVASSIRRQRMHLWVYSWATYPPLIKLPLARSMFEQYLTKIFYVSNLLWNITVLHSHNFNLAVEVKTDHESNITFSQSYSIKSLQCLL